MRIATAWPCSRPVAGLGNTPDTPGTHMEKAKMKTVERKQGEG